MWETAQGSEESECFLSNGPRPFGWDQNIINDEVVLPAKTFENLKDARNLETSEKRHWYTQPETDCTLQPTH